MLKQIDVALERYREELIVQTQKLVQLGSVKGVPQEGQPFGADIDECYRYTLKLCESLGYRTRGFDGYAVDAEVGEGEDVIGILGHMDVVPAGDNWDDPPFSGVIKNGRLYGRGCMDDKGPTLACLYAVKALLDAGVPFHKRVRVIMGMDEESGWECMAHYLPVAGEPDISFTPDGAFAVVYGEKGIFHFSLKGRFESHPEPGKVCIRAIHGGNRANMVPDKVQALLETDVALEGALREFLESNAADITLERTESGYILRTVGRSAHGSTPFNGINAIGHLFAFLRTLPMAADMAGLCNFYMKKIAYEHFGESMGMAAQDDISTPLTLNVGVIDYADGELELQCDVRYPIRADFETIKGTLEAGIVGSGLRCVNVSNKPPLYVDPQSVLVRKLMKAYRDVTGDMETQPHTISGGTYARAVKNAVAFGPVFPGHPEVGHKPNEWVAVDDLFLAMKVYAHAIYELLQED